MMSADKFQPLKKYTADEIKDISGCNPIIHKASYGSVLSVLIGRVEENIQYDFMIFPFGDGDAWFLVAIDGYMPSMT